MDMTGTPTPSRPNVGLIVVGLIVLTMGGLLLADRYFSLDVRLMRSWWPLVPIVMGAVRLATAHPYPDGRSRSRRSGVWLIMIGLWALVSDSHLFGFTFNTSWPLLVIGAGVLIVWRSLETGARVPSRRSHNP
jgi:LiaF transmembrane domain